MALILLQQIQGTTALFSACTVAFIVLAVLAFNVAGGFTRPSGGFIFAYSVVGVLFGIFYKVVAGEPAQSNLLQPERTIEVYVGSIGAMFAAAYVARRVRLKRTFLPRFSSQTDIYRSCVGCLLAGLAIFASGLLRTAPPAPGSLLAIIYAANAFLPLCILLGVTYEIRASGGRRSVNTPVILAILISFGAGVLYYSKEGMFTPFVCWLIPAAAQRYKVSLAQVAGLAVVLGLTVYYLVPYSQYGRNVRLENGSFSENLKINLLLLSNLNLVRKVYTQNSAETYVEGDSYRYYDKPQGFADRIQIVSSDDAIIDATEKGAVFGIFPTIFSFENIIPHFIWPEKPSISFGNMYAHELGILGDEDDSTGISFSPSGDAYHQAKWAGVLIILPLLSFMLFFVADSVCGDTRLSPFTLLTIIKYLHGAPEGGTVQFAAETFFGVAQIFLVAFLGAYVMPLVADVLLGPPKDRAGRDAPIEAKPGRLNPREAVEAVAE